MQSGEWRTLYAAAGLPDITHAARVVQKLGDEEKSWMGGWQVPTPDGPMLVTDDLAIQWEDTFYERLPAHQRVPMDHYLRGPRPRGLDRQEFAELRRPNPLPAWQLDSSAAHFQRLAELHELPWVPYHLPAKGRWPVVQVAHVRWAEMKGHLEVARLLSERHAEALADVPRLRDQMAEWLLEQGKWGLLHGMPRERVAQLWARAQSLKPQDASTRAQLDDLLARLGRDPPPLSAQPKVGDFIAWLPEDMAFPERRWSPVFEGPRPWISGMQPVSPAWELVAIGWPALPLLHQQMRSEQLLRNGGPSTDEWGAPAVALPHTLGELALAVAATIARRSFDTPDEFETWWRSEGHQGPPAPPKRRERRSRR